MSLEDISYEDKHEQNPFANILEYWRNPSPELDPVIIPDVVEFITPGHIPQLLNEALNDKYRTNDMTNLGDILLGNTISLDDSSQEAYLFHDDVRLNRMSLAYEKLSYMPKVVLDEFGPYIKILDISNNDFKNLEFLEHFTELTSLICDRNPISSDANIPWMSKLELLYLNHCKIDDLFWIETLRYNCPNLRYLSLMGNPIAPSFLTGRYFYEYLRYRLYLISILPSLVHLDDKTITEEERAQAKKMFPPPLIKNVFKNTRHHLPYYLRKLSSRMMSVLNSFGQSSAIPKLPKVQRNRVI